MKQVCPSFVEAMSDSSQHRRQSPHTLPDLSSQYSKSWPLCFCTEPRHCFEEGCSVGWELLSLPCGLHTWDCLRYHPRLDCARKWSAEILQSESQKEPQIPPGKVDNKDSNVEEPDQSSPSLHSISEQGLELVTCAGGDYPEGDPAYPEGDPASDSPRCLNCWLWLQRAFGRKRKNCRNLRRPKTCN